MITRRSILIGILAAPLVVRSGILMPVKPVEEWSQNELLAGVFGGIIDFHAHQTTAGFDAAFKVAALRERANPRYIEYARQQFGHA